MRCYPGWFQESGGKTFFSTKLTRYFFSIKADIIYKANIIFDWQETAGGWSDETVYAYFYIQYITSTNVLVITNMYK